MPLSMSSASLSWSDCSAVGCGGLFVVTGPGDQEQADDQLLHAARVTLCRSTKKGPPRRSGPSCSLSRREAYLFSVALAAVAFALSTALPAFSTALPVALSALSAALSRVVGRGVDVDVGVVLDRGLVRHIVVGVALVARGQAEREDRNGHNGNLLHDRSTPFKCAPEAGTVSASGASRSRPGRRAIAVIPTSAQEIIFAR